MFRHLAFIGCLFTLLALTLPSHAQVNPNNLPANTVVGRLGTGTGPAQAIPFATLNTNLSTSTFKFTGVPPLADTFQGNGGSGQFFITGTATAGSSTLTEWVAQFPMTSSFGSANHTTAAKGGIYAHCIANVGSADCFGANFIGQASSGLGNTANVTGLEVDTNNGNQNYGESGFRYNAGGPPNQYGITIASSSANNGTTGFRSSAALYIDALSAPSTQGSGAWNRGIAFGNSAIAQNTIQDASSSNVSYLMTGTHTTGIDMGGATLTTGLILPNNSPITQKDNGGTARNILQLTSSNSLNIGDGVHNIFAVGGAGVSVAPNTDNQTALGGSSNRWASFFATTATVGGISFPSTVGQLRFVITGVNFNSANTDNAVTITLPTGVSRWTINSIRINNASASISTATIGVFTATGGGGQTIAANQAITVTASGADTNNNTMILALTNSTTEAYNDTTVQVRIGTAQGSAATADVIIVINVLS